jgi:hypothetical protein
MANKIARFGGTNFFPWLSGVNYHFTPVKCVIRFGGFVRILEDQWK